MDLFPLYNSVRIAIISTIIVFFLGIFLAYYIEKTNKYVRSILDVILTLPLVLPPTVVGYIILLVFGPRQPFGKFLIDTFSINMVMQWYSGILASVVVSFPLMYRTARGAFASFDENLANAGKTLGLSNFYIFWKIRIPCCLSGLAAGAILSFARGIGEYGATSMIAGYIPNRTATISTTVYQLWRTNEENLALIWIIINVVLSTIVLFGINCFEGNKKYNAEN